LSALAGTNGDHDLQKHFINLKAFDFYPKSDKSGDSVRSCRIKQPQKWAKGGKGDKGGKGGKGGKGDNGGKGDRPASGDERRRVNDKQASWSRERRSLSAALGEKKAREFNKAAREALGTREFQISL
jgi:hypothetical protein